MRRRRLIVDLMALGAVAVTFAIAGSHSDGAPRALLLDERFSGDRLDHAIWRTCYWWADRGCTIASNHELETYRPGQVRVRAGRVALVAERRRSISSDGDPRPFTSGMISTGPGVKRPAGFVFRYGRVAMRARVPAGAGLWPAFWLLPASRRSVPEIDVFEATSDEPRIAQLHLHYRDADGVERSRGHDVRGVAAGWHEFGLAWRPGRLRWSIDGHARWTVTGDQVPAEPMYLIANLAVSGDPPPTHHTPSPARYAIDWIRVWR